MSIVMLEKRARGNFFLFNWGLVKEARRAIKSAWRLGGRGSLEMGYGQLSQRLAGDGLALLLRFSGDRSFQGGARSGEAWRGRNDIGDGGWDSGNRVATGSTKERTSSVGDIEEDCRDLWWSSIHRASIASDVSWIH